MKLLLTIWISAVLTQEVFCSTLVRYPRHAVSKPTSSVHTEYEATYEQKGKQGNGSYSTVSGKQEVVHDNCNDNWNSFADKCATLIKDLVASLGNAVSSKPGDATNLQLRIRNTFKHFDSTDNCTCLAKNSLTSLFDNITASTVQPVTASNGAGADHQSSDGEIISPAQTAGGNNVQTQSRTCEGESCNEDSDSRQKAATANAQLVQERVGQPNLALTNVKDVDPELADTSEESSTTNSRRGVRYPKIIIKDPAQRSGNPGADVSHSEQSPPSPGSSSESKKVVSPFSATPRPAPAPAKATGSPTEAVVPLSQSQSSTKSRPLESAARSQASTPQQSSFQPVSPVDRPPKSNGIVKSGISVKPVPALSSASRISSPSGLNEDEDEDDNAGSRSKQVGDAIITPVEGSVKPVNSKPVVPVNVEGSPAANGAESDEIPVIVAAVPTESVNSAVGEPQIGSRKGSSAGKDGGSSRTPSVVSVAEPEMSSDKSGGDKDDDCDEEKGSESDKIPIATPVAAEPEMTSGNSEGSTTANNAEPIQTPSAVSVAEPEITSVKSKGGEDDDCDEEKKSDETPVVPPVVSTAESVSGVAVEPQIVSSKGSPAASDAGSSQSPSVVPVPEPIDGGQAEITSSKSGGDKDDDCDEEKGSESDKIPIAVDSVPAEPEMTSGNSKGSTTANNAEPIQTPSVVSVAEPEITSSNSGGDKADDCDEEKGSESDVISAAEPVEDAFVGPQITSNDAEGDTHAEGVAGNGPQSDKRAVAKPVPSSFQDPSVEVSDEGTNVAPNPRSLPVPAIPVSNSGDSEMPVITQAADSTQAPLLTSDDSAPPATASASDTANVIPGLTVKQPQSRHSSQKTPSAVVPVINSTSNLPDSTGPIDNAGTINPSPIYESLPTAPSATPSSDSAVTNGSPQQPTSKQEVMAGVPLTSERGKTTQSGADQSPSAKKGVHAAPAAVSQRSQEPANTAMPPKAGKGGKEAGEKVFIVTPVPAYPERDDPVVVKSEGGPTDRVVERPENADPPTGSERTGVPDTEPAKEVIASEPQRPSTVTVTNDENEKSQPQVGPKLATAAPVYAASVKSTSEMSQPESQSLQAGGGAPGVAVVTPQMKDDRQEILLTTPIPVIPVVSKEAAEPSASGKPSLQQHPLFPSLGNKKSAANQPKQNTVGPAGLDRQIPEANPVDEAVAPIGVAPGPQPESLPRKAVKPAVAVVQTPEDSDLTKPTTFQTTSTDPTPPQKSVQSPPSKNPVSLTRPPSLPQGAHETDRTSPATSPRTPHDDDDDDDDEEEEDCCSCESCTEEEATNPQQYKEMACRDLEEARKELKAIFDKIKKKLKCGKKAPQKIVAS